MVSPVASWWQDDGSRYSNIPYRLSIEDTERFLIDLAIGAKNCGMNFIAPKDSVASRTEFPT